jgi:hypothetical protein
MSEGWVMRAAATFWQQVGGTLPYPRDLSSVVVRSFPIAVVSLPSLSTYRIEQWFARRDIPYRFTRPDRPLHGCIVAVRGQGVLFVNADNDVCERRFTVAHETAHFLLDYLECRQRALRSFGSSIMPVLDGERPPTAEERIHAVLANISFGVFTDLMVRNSHGDIDQSIIVQSEDRADRLALELLAPAEDVLASISNASLSLKSLSYLTMYLVDTYGLPRSIARTYADLLLRDHFQISMSQWLGL